MLETALVVTVGMTLPTEQEVYAYVPDIVPAEQVLV